MENQYRDNDVSAAEDIKPESVPSLDASFEWLKDVLQRQQAEAAALDNKTIALFTISAAIIGLGLGIPLGTSGLPIKDFLSSIFGWLSLITFIAIAIMAVIALWCLEYVTLDDPQAIREYYWELTNFQFKLNMLLHTEDFHKKNHRNLILKGKTSD